VFANDILDLGTEVERGPADDARIVMYESIERTKMTRCGIKEECPVAGESWMRELAVEKRRKG
jgi:hypothetical protein